MTVGEFNGAEAQRNYEEERFKSLQLEGQLAAHKTSLREAICLLREAMEIVEGDYEAARGRDSEIGNNIRAFLAEHCGESK